MPELLVNQFEDFIILKIRQRINEDFNDYIFSMAELFAFIIDDVLHIKAGQFKRYRTIDDFFHFHKEDVRKKYGVMPGNTFRAHFFYHTSAWVDNRLKHVVESIAKETPGEFEDWLRDNVFLMDIELESVMKTEPGKVYSGIYDHELIGTSIQLLFPQSLLGKLEKIDARFLYKKSKQAVKQHSVKL